VAAWLPESSCRRRTGDCSTQLAPVMATLFAADAAVALRTSDVNANAAEVELHHNQLDLMCSRSSVSGGAPPGSQEVGWRRSCARSGKNRQDGADG
jgi:hypothetical protein